MTFRVSGYERVDPRDSGSLINVQKGSSASPPKGTRSGDILNRRPRRDPAWPHLPAAGERGGTDAAARGLPSDEHLWCDVVHEDCLVMHICGVVWCTRTA